MNASEPLMVTRAPKLTPAHLFIGDPQGAQSLKTWLEALGHAGAKWRRALTGTLLMEGFLAVDREGPSYLSVVEPPVAFVYEHPLLKVFPIDEFRRLFLVDDGAKS